MIKGLHIDICRHFISVEIILNTINLIADLGFNTLHLHLSDDQGMPFESIKYPQIHKHSESKSENSEQAHKLFLSIADQEKIADLCKIKSIDIIPELDIPGHATAFKHVFLGEPIETKLGMISTSYIDIDTDLPIIFDLLTELKERFNSKYIHVGCDEAKNFEFYPELIKLVSDFATGLDVKFIVWDDVVGKIDTVPSNMIVQRWRFRTSGKIINQNIPYILSMNYYLDHCNDPLFIYGKDPNPFGGNLIGWIACTWTELITELNFRSTIIPSIYVIANRWKMYEDRREVNPLLLPKIMYDMCQSHGFPDMSPIVESTWKSRKWASFLRPDDPRSCSSVDTSMVLHRDHDLYPVFSNYLINLLYDFYLSHHELESTVLFTDLFMVRKDYLRNILKTEFDFDDTDLLYGEISMDKLNDLCLKMKSKSYSYFTNGLLPIMYYLKNVIRNLNQSK
jgi:hypothetical protein